MTEVNFNGPVNVDGPVVVEGDQTLIIRDDEPSKRRKKGQRPRGGGTGTRVDGAAVVLGDRIVED